MVGALSCLGGRWRVCLGSWEGDGRCACIAGGKMAGVLAYLGVRRQLYLG